MAELTINGRMHVKTLKAEFKNAFGASLRVYKSTHFAPDDATLASCRESEGAKAGEMAVKGTITVADFERDFEDLFGIKVQVANADNTKLAKNDATLTEAAKA